MNVEKKYVVTKVVINGDQYGNLSYVDKAFIVDTIDQGKEKIDEMLKGFVKERYPDDYVFDDNEIEDDVNFLKSKECHFQEIECEDDYFFTFDDVEGDNGTFLFSVTLIG